MVALEQRSEKVLRTIVTEYISTGEPVGSRTVAKRGGFGLSAASVRNIMSDLTDMGLISQPHVSAGRVPTDLAYRLYVDSLLKNYIVDDRYRETIERLLKDVGLDPRDVLRQSSLVLAGLSRQAGVVTTSPLRDQTFKTIEFIKAAEDRILVVLVSTSGFVQNKIIYDEDNISQETLESFGRMLDDMLKDLDLLEARERIERELLTEKVEFNLALLKALRMSHSILSQDDTREVFIGGQSNILLDPEFSEIKKLKAVLTTFEEKTKLLKLLDKTLQAEGIQVFIGSEHGLDEIENCSVVAYPIRVGDSVVASIGVVGPKRMNYSVVVPLVDTTARILTQLLRTVVESRA
ncbi:MAG: heat-inducible transcriptional repressor HrcA [Thermodesulfobacteriota bacterium]